VHSRLPRIAAGQKIGWPSPSVRMEPSTQHPVEPTDSNLSLVLRAQSLDVCFKKVASHHYYGTLIFKHIE